MKTVTKPFGKYFITVTMGMNYKNTGLYYHEMEVAIAGTYEYKTFSMVNKRKMLDVGIFYEMYHDFIEYKHKDLLGMRQGDWYSMLEEIGNDLKKK